MSVRSLSVKILLAASVNIILVLTLLAAGGFFPWPRNLEDLVLWRAGPEMSDLAQRVALDLAATTPSDFDRVIAEYADGTGEVFVLCRNDGSTAAGDRRTLPPAVIERVIPPNNRADRPGRGGPDGQFQGPDRGRGLGLDEGRGGPPNGRFGGPQRGRGRGRRGGPPPMPPFFVSTSGSPRYWMGMRIPIPENGADTPTPGVLLIASDSLFASGFLTPTFWSGIVLLAAAGVTALCWIPLLRGMTRSIDQLEGATAHIAQGRFDHRANEARSDELGSLARSINAMAARLDRTAADQTRFLGDTAHELRSPIGRVQVALEILETKATDATRPYLKDLREDVDELTLLTNELLEFARTRLSSPTSPPESINVEDLVVEVLRNERAMDVGIEIQPGLTVMAHRKELARALGNIVRNAMRYAGALGPIVVSGKKDGGRVEISVSDSGHGVPAEALEHLFTPFYRIDSSRNRRSGGVGLGLAIARTAVARCDGTITARNKPTGGLEVTISLG